MASKQRGLTAAFAALAMLALMTSACGSKQSTTPPVIVAPTGGNNTTGKTATGPTGSTAATAGNSGATTGTTATGTATAGGNTGVTTVGTETGPTTTGGNTGGATGGNTSGTTGGNSGGTTGGNSGGTTGGNSGGTTGTSTGTGRTGSTAIGATCTGKHRWPVKTGMDPDAPSVDLSSPQPTTIATLVALRAPANRPEDARVPPTETHAWVLRDVHLIRYKESDDSDFTTVIEDASGNTMIAEIPDPTCVGTISPWRNRISAVRQVFQAKLSPTTKHTNTDQVVSLWGVGFFDSVHGQTDVAPNGIEIHPILGMCFGQGCNPL